MSNEAARSRGHAIPFSSVIVAYETHSDLHTHSHTHSQTHTLERSSMRLPLTAKKDRAE